MYTSIEGAALPLQHCDSYYITRPSSSVWSQVSVSKSIRNLGLPVPLNECCQTYGRSVLLILGAGQQLDKNVTETWPLLCTRPCRLMDAVCRWKFWLPWEHLGFYSLCRCSWPRWQQSSADSMSVMITDGINVNKHRVLVMAVRDDSNSWEN